jgi:hypothetical protein
MPACICVCVLVCFLYVRGCFIYKCGCAVCASVDENVHTYLYIPALVRASVYVFGFKWEGVFALSSGGGGYMCSCV